MVRTKLLIVLSMIVVLLALVFLYFRGDEDSWIRDSRGMWIKHGNPVFVPVEVSNQQNALSCASEIYADANFQRVNLSSQCLGTCGDYSVDLVNVPRTAEDDLIENQCQDFIAKKTHHFIELNTQGNLVRIQ